LSRKNSKKLQSDGWSLDTGIPHTIIDFVAQDTVADLFGVPFLEDSLQGVSHKPFQAVNHCCTNQNTANWFSQRKDRRAEFQGEFMVNKMFDYNF
jgi:hypothetical protein